MASGDITKEFENVLAILSSYVSKSVKVSVLV